MARINRQLCSPSPDGLSGLDLPWEGAYDFLTCFFYFLSPVFGVLWDIPKAAYFFSCHFLVEIWFVLLAGSTGSDEREISIYFSHLYII